MKLLETWDPNPRLLMALWISGALCAFVYVFLNGPAHPGVWACAMFIAAAPVLAAIDFVEHRLPDIITLPLAGLCALGILGGALTTGQYSALLGAACAAVGVTGVFFIMFLLSRGAFGFGDVKLGVSMGLCLGTISFIAPILGPFIGMLLAAIVGLVLIVMKKATTKTNIALGPYLIAGTIAMIVAG